MSIKFELVNNAPIGDCIIKPMRQTELSAGYDFYMPYEVNIAPGEMALVIVNGIKKGLIK